LSTRGDKIISKDYRNDVSRETEDIFFRKVKFWSGDADPCFNLDGITFLYIRKNNLYFVMTTRKNVSPVLCLELLQRICRLFQDYCGTLSEESLRKNYTLCYEILDEVFDFGYIQTTSTDQLKVYIMNEPIEVESSDPGISLPLIERKTITSNAAKKAIGKNKKNEIFVDIIEKINVVFDGQANIMRAEITGSIIMKSYLTGNPIIRIGLNEDLIIGSRSAGTTGSVSSNAIRIDSCNFNELCQMNEFDHTRILTIKPPNGEFTLLSYRVIEAIFSNRMPFRVQPYLSVKGKHKVEAVIKIRADISKNTASHNVIVIIPVPKSTASVFVDFGSGTANTYEYDQSQKQIYWKIKKFQGETEQLCRIKIALDQPLVGNVRNHFGPIRMNFELPMHNVSGLQVRFLKIEERSKNYNPGRWVRYITRSGSYVSRT